MSEPCLPGHYGLVPRAVMYTCFTRSSGWRDGSVASTVCGPLIDDDLRPYSTHDATCQHAWMSTCLDASMRACPAWL